MSFSSSSFCAAAMKAGYQEKVAPDVTYLPGAIPIQQEHMRLQASQSSERPTGKLFQPTAKDKLYRESLIAENIHRQSMDKKRISIQILEKKIQNSQGVDRQELEESLRNHWLELSQQEKQRESIRIQERVRVKELIES